MKTEEWKDVGIIYGIDFTGLYQVSNLGDVKSLNYRRSGREEILTPNIDEDGYLHVVLCKNGKKKQLGINRLVAIEFNLPIPEELKHLPLERLEADHIDTDKTNNAVWNLRWTDRSGNMKNPLTRQHMSEAVKGEKNPFYGKQHTEETKRKMSKARKGVFNTKKSKPVLQINKDTLEVIKEWPSLSEVQRQMGFANQHISKCCNGKRKSAYGFKWNYA